MLQAAMLESGLGKDSAQAKPAKRVDQSCETQRDVHPDGSGPGFENGLSVWCHWECAILIDPLKAALPPRFQVR